MVRLVFLLGVLVLLVGIDGYVYRNWSRFAKRHRRRLGWTLPVYRTMIGLVPLTIGLYFFLFRWWEVEPKLPRALLIGLWAVYYVPKAPIALVLLLSNLVIIGRNTLRESRRSRADRPAASPREERRIDRAEFLRALGWGAAGIPFVAVGYGALRTLYDFRIHRVDIPLAGLPEGLDGLTIVQLSDLHAGSMFDARPMQEAVRLANGLRPDLITITGDYVNHDADETRLILPALRDLRADLGVYGCLGNHDHYADTPSLVARLGATPIRMLINQHRTLRIGGSDLHLIGTDNTGFRQNYADLKQAVSGITPHPDGEEVRILLAHDPTFWDAEVRPGYPEIDLMLCGHTHGGQIGFEFGPLRWSLARIMYERWAGLYTEPRIESGGKQFLYVNRGVGTVGPPLRIGMQPEVTVLTLRKA